MASTRATEVAEVLWELKRADKIATYTTIAKRAGFSAGSKGRTIINTLRTVRRGWPHLQWWRAVKDDLRVDQGSEHEKKLIESGFELELVEGEEKAPKRAQVSIVSVEEHLMTWEEAGAEEAAE